LENVLLDFGGGFFSFTQIIIKAVYLDTPVIGSSDSGFNIVKFLLSVIAMFFDLIFMFQHYVLYRDKWQNKEKHDGRLDTLNRL